jgi:CelD/BcsL family acetyltransferase involved in cellulose biosynthesis
MQIEIVRPLELSPDDLAAWTRLQDARLEFGNPFLSPQWPRALARAGGPDAERGRVAVLRRADGEAAGFLPARVGRFTALPMGAPMTDYQALVADPDVQVEPARLARAFGVQRLDLYNFLPGPHVDPSLHASAESLIADLSDGYDAYARSRKDAGSDVLKDAAKKRRKLEREHGPASFTPLSGCRRSFDALVAFKRAQLRETGQPDLFDFGWPLRVLELAFEKPEPGFRAALFTLEVGGRMIAANLSVLGRGVVHAWFISHDPEFARYSPGVLLFDEILRWAPAQGYRELDLGPGDYRFKLQLASTSRRVAHGYLGTPSPAVLLRDAQYRLRAAAESLPLGRASQLPGKAMRRIDYWRGLRA